jgi:hypothetical protein
MKYMVKRVNYGLEYIVEQEPNNIKSIDILNEENRRVCLERNV